MIPPRSLPKGSNSIFRGVAMAGHRDAKSNQAKIESDPTLT